jgi:hypothetical protein
MDTKRQNASGSCVSEKILLTSNDCTAMYCNVLTKFELKVNRMKTKILILLALPVMFYACKKDTYNTKPQISVKSINSKQAYPPAALLFFQIEFTDAEGDIQDTLYVQKFSRVCPNQPGVQFTTRTGFLIFHPTSNLKGILEIGYAYNTNIQGYTTISGCGIKNDTAYFKFWLKDKANNISDTITTENIVLLK